jgi:hypothetical protein
MNLIYKNNNTYIDELLNTSKKVVLVRTGNKIRMVLAEGIEENEIIVEDLETDSYFSMYKDDISDIYLFKFSDIGFLNQYKRNPTAAMFNQIIKEVSAEHYKIIKKIEEHNITELQVQMRENLEYFGAFDGNKDNEIKVEQKIIIALELLKEYIKNES